MTLHRWFTAVLVFVFCPLGATGCLDPSIGTVTEPPPVVQRLEIRATSCAQPVAVGELPVRVLFVVDTSVSMAVSDPTGRRVEALNEYWQQALEIGGPDTSVGIIAVGSTAKSQVAVDTDGDGIVDSYFTRNPGQLGAAMNQLLLTNGISNMVNGLSEAYFELRSELLALHQPTRALTRFVVIFVGDSEPSLDAGRVPTDLGESSAALVELANTYGVRHLHVHAMELGSSNVSSGKTSSLQRIAEGGGGQYVWFDDPATATLESITWDATPPTLGVQDVMLFNTNRVNDCGDLLWDRDGDGLSDDVEEALQTDPGAHDSDGDGLSDLVEVVASTESAAFHPDSAEDHGCADVATDTDGDGLNDCEETFFGTSKRNPDTDADGKTDWVEVRHGTAPTVADGTSDLDFDGLQDGVEISLGQDNRCADQATHAGVGYRTELQSLGVDGSGAQCLEAAFANIDPAPAAGTETNRYHVFASVLLDALAPASLQYRIACVDASVDSGRVEVVPTDFRPLELFDPDTDCRTNGR